MTVDDEASEGMVSRSVIVGIRIDGLSRELLDWALVKVADPGDHVVAIHVCKDSDSSLKMKPLLDEYLAEYEGLCTLKKISLSGQVLIGNSIKKVIVREAKKLATTAVIVGLNKESSFRACASVAKFCVKNLPSTTEVQAIHNGKVIFRRSLYHQLPGLRDPKPSYSLSLKPPLESTESKTCESKKSEKPHSSEKEPKFSRVIPKTGNLHRFQKHKSLSSLSFISEEIIHETPGWPLLRAASSADIPANEARKMPLLKWVMSFPDRSLPEAEQFQLSFSSGNTRISFSRENISRSICKSEIRLSKYDKPLEILDKILKRSSSSCKWFAYNVIKTSTSKFSPDNLIGKGGCNNVYKGVLPNGKAVAVKVLKSSKESLNDFTQEVHIMTTLCHKSITPLLGICVGEKELISVYDFFSKGNLGDNLRGTNKESSVLSWEVRFRLALEIAEALKYLHEECTRPIIHRDVKSSNILLSINFEAQLSDFGLAMWGPLDMPFVTINDVLGTFGYIAPEYFMYGKVSNKIDVYSFGVVLLELLSGREPICSDDVKGQESLVMWAKPRLESGDLRSIADPNLNGDVDTVQFERVALAARLCLTRSARFRPKMSKIFQVLKGEIDIDEWLNLWLEDQKCDENLDDEVYTNSSADSCLGLAMLDVDDTSTSFSSSEQSNRISYDEKVD